MAWFGKDFNPYSPIGGDQLMVKDLKRLGFTQSLPSVSSPTQDSNPTCSADLHTDAGPSLDQRSGTNDETMQIDDSHENDHESTISFNPGPPPTDNWPPQPEVQSGENDHQVDTGGGIHNSSSFRRTESLSALLDDSRISPRSNLLLPGAAELRAKFLRKSQAEDIAKIRTSCRGVKLEVEQDQGNRLAFETFHALERFQADHTQPYQEEKSAGSERVDDFDDPAQRVPHQEESAGSEGTDDYNVPRNIQFDWSMLHFCKRFVSVSSPPTSMTAYESNTSPQVQITQGTSDAFWSGTGSTDDPDIHLTPYQTDMLPQSHMTTWTPTALYANTNHQVHPPPEISVSIADAQGYPQVIPEQTYCGDNTVSSMTPYDSSAIIPRGNESEPEQAQSLFSEGSGEPIYSSHPRTSSMQSSLPSASGPRINSHERSTAFDHLPDEQTQDSQYQGHGQPDQYQQYHPYQQSHQYQQPHQHYQPRPYPPYYTCNPYHTYYPDQSYLPDHQYSYNDQNQNVPNTFKSPSLLSPATRENNDDSTQRSMAVVFEKQRGVVC
ncbi:hypothetical protein BCR39DRAFT_556596 [Naematelia encephala]|uniref:Uncharacterized protein n=1 Tax=Naematelia encephala TaxID=71784 RepID=A0A1Y2BHE0_9TREE|nr:hypothetical protein BCR39DRAFT_556596 [Naematelia encephala]